MRSISTEAFVGAPEWAAVGRPMEKTSALWDTGATNCVITKGFAAQLGIVPITQAPVRHGGGQTIENVYLIDIALPNGTKYPGVRVTECPNTVGDFGIIIGMDIICTGDLAVTNHNGKTVVSFRVPSKKAIDFNIEMKQDNEALLRFQQKASKHRAR